MSHVATITIDHTKVPGDLTDYVGLIVPDGSAGYADLYALCLEGGGDIRLFKSDDTTELAREMVLFSVTDETGEIHYKYSGTLSSSVDTDIHVYADGFSADYAVGATYGRNAVWSEYVAVWHKGGGDSSTGSHNTTVVNTTAGGYASPHHGSATSYNDTGAISYAAASADFRALDTEGGYQFWSKIFTLPKTYEYNSYGGMFGVGNTGNNNNLVLERALGGNNPSMIARSTFLEATTPTINVWDKMTFTWDASNITCYKNGVQDVTSASGVVVTSGGEFTLGAKASNETSTFLQGALWEFRLPKFLITNNWDETEYNNQNSYSTFYSVAAVVAGGGGFTPTPLIHQMQMAGGGV